MDAGVSVVIFIFGASAPCAGVSAIDSAAKSGSREEVLREDDRFHYRATREFQGLKWPGSTFPT
jgi:hypothetical protein